MLSRSSGIGSHGESLTGHIKSTENPADIATKIMANGQKRRNLVNKLLYDLYDHEDHHKDANSPAKAV